MKDFNKAWEKLNKLDISLDTESLSEDSSAGQGPVFRDRTLRLHQAIPTVERVVYVLENIDEFKSAFNYLWNYEFKQAVSWLSDLKAGALSSYMTKAFFVNKILNSSSEYRAFPKLDEKGSMTTFIKAARVCLNILAIFVACDRLLDKLADVALGSFVLDPKSGEIDFYQCTLKHFRLLSRNFEYQGITDYSLDVKPFITNLDYDKIGNYTVKETLNTIRFKIKCELQSPIATPKVYKNILGHDDTILKYKTNWVVAEDVALNQLVPVLNKAIIDMEKDLKDNRPTVWYIVTDDNLTMPINLSTTTKASAADRVELASKIYRPERSKMIANKALADLLWNPLLDQIAKDQWTQDAAGNYYIKTDITDKDLKKYTKKNNLPY